MSSAHEIMNQSKIGGCDCSFVCHMAYTEEQIKEWIEKRFGFYSTSYFMAWLSRFKSGTAYKFMDDESRKTWREVRIQYIKEPEVQ